MTNAPRQSNNAASRVPDCVTEVRKGSTIITVSGFFKPNAAETAADKMVKVVAAEGLTETLRKTGIC